jgi:hypothetical protein
MHPDQRTTLASCAGSKILALDDHHPLHTGLGQVKGGTGPIGASPNHDHICCFHSLLLDANRLQQATQLCIMLFLHDHLDIGTTPSIPETSTVI